MMMKTGNGKQQLLGTTSLDLSGMCGMDDDGIDLTLPQLSSGWGWRRGSFPFYDLMGNKIGHATVRLRLCSFGDGIVPHIQPEVQVADSGNVVVDEPFPSLEGQVPFPVEVLETMQRLEAKIDRLEVLKTEPPALNTMMLPGKPVYSSIFPRQGSAECTILPPAMYFKNIQEEETHEASDDIVPPHTPISTVKKFQGLLSPRYAEERQFADTSESRLVNVNKSNKKSPLVTKPPQNIKSSVSSSRTEKEERPSVIRIRLTRTQRMRQMANQRQYNTSPQNRLGHLASGIALSQLKNDDGKMQLASLIDSQDELSRAKQLEKAWKGQVRINRRNANPVPDSFVMNRREEEFGLESLERSSLYSRYHEFDSSNHYFSEGP